MQFDRAKLKTVILYACSKCDAEQMGAVKLHKVLYFADMLDPGVEEPEARADRLVDGDVAAIWEFETQAEESDCLAQWIEREVQAGNVEPHDAMKTVSAPASSSFRAMSKKILLYDSGRVRRK
jgi:hypothetical protein